MAISGPASYLPTTDEFLGHWSAVDSALGAGNEIVLPGGVNRDGLENKRDTLEEKRSVVQAKNVARELARETIVDLKTTLLLRLNQLKEKVGALHSGSKYDRLLPRTPGIAEGMGNFVEPMDAAESLWEHINADAAIADISLLGNYTLIMFQANLTTLKNAYKTWHNAGIALSIAIEERNDVQDEIYAILLNYRKLLPTNFVKTHALVESLPRLTPLPGSTPNAVTAHGEWVPATQQAKITYSASDAADIVRYELRFCPGPDYNTDLESVVASLDPADPREFLTNAGLTAPGNVASFKVYVITDTGNEKGSNPVVITHPAP